MLTTLTPFCNLVDAGSHVTKTEAIKRYRQMSNFSYLLLQVLCMLQFSVLGKDERGQLYIS